jgi:hypothetical protein
MRSAGAMLPDRFGMVSFAVGLLGAPPTPVSAGWILV